MKVRNNLTIYLSLLAALILDSIYLSSSFLVIKPTFVLLALIYWNIALPDKVGIGLSLVIGIIVDFIEGSVLGTYPLLFVVVAYLCQRFFYQFRVMKIIQQSIILFVLFLFIKQYLAIDFSFSYGSNFNLFNSSNLLITFLYSLLSAIAWPVLFYCLRYSRRRWIKN
ncbi:MAG: rod shape-determining protein MreD [SAR86 cluster bacterium]|nr:rod shape-determining protein MreD [SAR86 cluster bacterium]